MSDLYLKRGEGGVVGGVGGLVVIVHTRTYYDGYSGGLYHDQTLYTTYTIPSPLPFQY